ncbi:MAG: ATP-binding protein [Pseudomonadota bacterium]|jgi:Predicted ATPase|nr:MAG: ATP-binding protein [Pseudomonadota bacterium]
MQDYEKLGVFYLGREYDADSHSLKDALLLYDSRSLTTHAVCVGMTGSGKTGLCIALLEEAAIDGIPAICIDPKGDLGNLLLTFPKLAPSDFVPWVDPGEAQRRDLSVDEYAARTAETWRNGLAEWAQSPDRIARFRNSVDIAIYTPGSEAGLPLSVLRSFSAPPPEMMNDTDALRGRVNAVVSGLLNLLGRDADPVNSREHVLLSNLLERAWRDGISLDVASVIAAVQRPPFDRVGAFDLETYFPARERLELAMAINNLLASPGFSAWTTGEPLDVQRLLFTAKGKPRISIISVAHLSDSERMFIVTLVLNEVIAWMRTQSGTGSLRAILYMDEIFGYFPPTANPPSKQPMLQLLKQGRAFGLGCVLATQNPADLDYKGLANAGTWFIGRLQTERDKMRVIEGLQSALGDALGQERGALDRMLSNLPQRVFLMRNVHEKGPVLFKTRWTLSYLRGPLTGMEISRLMGPHKSEARRGAQAPSATQLAAGENAFPRPTLPPDVPEYFMPRVATAEAITYRPMIMGTAKLHFVDAKLGLDEWCARAYLAPLSEDGERVLWNEARVIPELPARLESEPAAQASFAPLPATALRSAAYRAWGRSLAAHLYETARLEVLVCDTLDMSSEPGESERDFRARLALRVREKRDAEVEALRRKYAPRFASLEERERRAAERAARERSQLSHQKMQTALSVGASILGALLGRRRLSATTVQRAATAARAAGRIGRESEDVERADENLEAVQKKRAELQQQFEADCAAIERVLDAANVELRRVRVSPRKSDITVEEVALVWTPWRRGADGLPSPAFQVGAPGT